MGLFSADFNEFNNYEVKKHCLEEMESLRIDTDTDERANKMLDDCISIVKRAFNDLW